MPLAMDYVIDCNEQDEFEVRYNGVVIGTERHHDLAVSMVTGHIAGRCERAEARVAELEAKANADTSIDARTACQRKDQTQVMAELIKAGRSMRDVLDADLLCPDCNMMDGHLSKCAAAQLDKALSMWLEANRERNCFNFL